MRTPDEISRRLPPQLRGALVEAGFRRDINEIDRLTDLAAQEYPQLVLPRTTCRTEFQSRAAGTKSESLAHFLGRAQGRTAG